MEFGTQNHCSFSTLQNVHFMAYTPQFLSNDLNFGIKNDLLFVKNSFILTSDQCESFHTHY